MVRNCVLIKVNKTMSSREVPVQKFGASLSQLQSKIPRRRLKQDFTEGTSSSIFTD